MGRGRREDVAAVERPRDRIEHVSRVVQLPGVGDTPLLLGGGNEQAVVGPDIDPPGGVAHRECSPVTAHSRVDDGEVHALRHIGDRVREDERALKHRKRLDPVGDVDDGRLRRDPGDHAVARSDEIVPESEVGQERDEHGSRLLRRGDGGDQALDVRCLCLGRHPQPRGPRGRRRLRADRNDRQRRIGSRERERGRRRGDDGEVALDRGRDAAGPGTGRRRPRPARRTSSDRAPSAPAKSTRPAGRGSSARRPSWVDTVGTRSTSPQASAVARPIAATRAARPRPAGGAPGHRSRS